MSLSKQGDSPVYPVIAPEMTHAAVELLVYFVTAVAAWMGLTLVGKS